MKRDLFKLSTHIAQKATQQNTMTPHLQEAIKLLQFSYEELVPFLEHHINENPFLNELTPPSNDTHTDFPTPRKSSEKEDQDSFDTYLAAPLPTLEEKITQQIKLFFNQQTDRNIAHTLADHLDDAGYFKADIKKIAQTHTTHTAHVKRILTKLKQCEPSGLFASDLCECLTLQLQDQNLFTPAYKTLLDNISTFINKNLPLKTLAQMCGVSLKEVSSMMGVIRSLNPKPAYFFDTTKNPSITPEVLMLWNKKTRSFEVTLNPSLRHTVHFDADYFATVKQAATKRSDKLYLSQRLIHANWLKKALAQRNKTLLSVAQEIVDHQADFFHKGTHYLKPLTLKVISNKLGIHESTVSRITTQKYMVTPLGLYELKYFFSSGFENTRGQEVSSSSLKQAILDLIQQESPEKPLSDLVIADILKVRGIPIARRTITKYREALNIHPSFERKRLRRLKNL